MSSLGQKVVWLLIFVSKNRDSHARSVMALKARPMWTSPIDVRFGISQKVVHLLSHRRDLLRFAGVFFACGKDLLHIYRKVYLGRQIG